MGTTRRNIFTRAWAAVSRAMSTPVAAPGPSVRTKVQVSAARKAAKRKKAKRPCKHFRQLSSGNGQNRWGAKERCLRAGS